MILLSRLVAMVALPDLPPHTQDTRASLGHSELQPVFGVEDVRVKLETEERVIRMELPPGVFDARHGDNTDVLLALLTQNKELEGRILAGSFTAHFIFSRPAKLSNFEEIVQTKSELTAKGPASVRLGWNLFFNNCVSLGTWDDYCCGTHRRKLKTLALC